MFQQRAPCACLRFAAGRVAWPGGRRHRAHWLVLYMDTVQRRLHACTRTAMSSWWAGARRPAGGEGKRVSGRRGQERRASGREGERARGRGTGRAPSQQQPVPANARTAGELDLRAQADSPRPPSHGGRADWPARPVLPAPPNPLLPFLLVTPTPKRRPPRPTALPAPPSHTSRIIHPRAGCVHVPVVHGDAASPPPPEPPPPSPPLRPRCGSGSAAAATATPATC